MKRADATLKRHPLRRLNQGLNRLGIRSRIFLYFLLFASLLLLLLWLFQIVLLDDFYRYQKTQMLTSSADTLCKNIDNEDLQLLIDRLSEANDVCVLIVDEQMETIATAEASPGCVIHHMSRRDLNRFVNRMNEGNGPILHTFPMMGFRNDTYDAKRFTGPVPPIDDGRAQSMIAMQMAETQDGREVYVFLNAIVTPVSSTVQTLRSQLYFISALLLLLSFLLSLLLSRRVAGPIVDTTVAARALSGGSYTPPITSGRYREIAELNGTLSQAAVDLRRVEEMQRELIANISHDLRTPLTLIEGYAEAVRDLPGEGTPENMQVIIDETKRLSTLVNAVLEYSVAKSGSSQPDCSVFDLTESVLRILERYQKLVQQDGYHIQYQFDRHLWVNADEIKVGQVVYNLINNAITYTGEDQTVTVRQTIREDGKALLEICDTGDGIDAEELPYIWSRYYRGQKPHKRATVGTGLGLCIVQGILDAHGLEYGVSSEKGKGSTFWFVLPVEPTPPKALPEA